jgi:GNAT superfamily N-acetyltransferase
MPKSPRSLRIRPATPRDIPAMVSLIRGLAKYEHLLKHCHTSPARLRRHGFGPNRYFETLIATRAGRPIGLAIYFFTYSTFASQPILFIEDIFVLPEERGSGAGKALMAALAKVAVKKRCTQMQWLVLDWNALAIDFYNRLGARLDKTWLLTRLATKHIRKLARKTS